MLTQSVLGILIGVLGLVAVACAALTFVRFSLNASKWGGFWTLSSMLNALRIINIRAGRFKPNGDEYEVHPLGDKFVVLVMGNWVAFYSHAASIKYEWCTGFRDHCTKFNTREEAEDKLSKCVSLSTKTEVGDAVYLLFLVPIALVLDVIWYWFCMSPVATVSVVSTVVLTFSIRWLSGKLSDTVSKTKENTDDIKVLKSKQK